MAQHERNEPQSPQPAPSGHPDPDRDSKPDRDERHDQARHPTSPPAGGKHNGHGGTSHSS
ncbi:MAG TPA: hypothetical protein VM491_05935 [Burkholderiaceae bacterium]|nr:hypothetical protein [Burkholderiaceae bacterium]